MLLAGIQRFRTGPPIEAFGGDDLDGCGMVRLPHLHSLCERKPMNRFMVKNRLAEEYLCNNKPKGSLREPRKSWTSPYGRLLPPQLALTV